MSLNIFVISMAGSIERRSRIEEQMRSLDLSFEFVDAVNGRDLPPAYLAQKATSRHIIQGGVAATTPREIGCALSHVKCADLIVQRGLPGAVILEDDAELLPPFADFVRNFNSKSGPLIEGAAIILGGLEDERPGELDRQKWLVPSLFGRIRLPGGIQLLKSVKSDRYFLRACAYYLDQTAARKLADFNRDVQTVADNWLLFSRKRVLSALYYPSPWLVRHPFEAEVPSLLEPERAALRDSNATKPGRARVSSFVQMKRGLRILLRQRFRLLP
jgi:glycosyl transferase family 25